MKEIYLSDGSMILIDSEEDFQKIKNAMNAVTRGNSPFVRLLYGHSIEYINVNYITYIKEV